MSVLEEKYKQEAIEAAGRARSIATVLQSNEWKLFVSMLEARYMSHSVKDCTSLRELAGRNARMNEIESIMKIMGHELNVAASAINRLKEMEIDIDKVTITNEPPKQEAEVSF